MRKRLQEAIDQQSIPAQYEAVLLGYALCGNGTAGLTAGTLPLVIPRAHDCIALLMGSRERYQNYFEQNPGVYFRSTGWLERGEDLHQETLRIVRNKTGAGYTRDELVLRYGEENGQYLFDELNAYQTRLPASSLTSPPAWSRTIVLRRRRARKPANKGWEFERAGGQSGPFRAPARRRLERREFPHRAARLACHGDLRRAASWTRNRRDMTGQGAGAGECCVGGEPDRLPLMPITMMFAAGLIGVKYRDYARDHRVLAEAQLRTAETFGFDYVSAISDPAREASDLGAAIEWFDDQPPAILESQALLAEKSRLVALAPPRSGDRSAHARPRGSRAPAAPKRAGSDLLVEGWVEGPCAMSADLRGVNTLMLDFFDDPAFVRDLFEFTIEMELRIRARADRGRRGYHRRGRCRRLAHRAEALLRISSSPTSRRLVRAIQAAGAPVRLHICGKTRKLYKRHGGDRRRNDRSGLPWRRSPKPARQWARTPVLSATSTRSA